MALFTVETAAEMGRRSAELRKQREQQRALILANQALPAILQTDHTSSKADRTRKQIELTDEMIDQCSDADTLDALTRSKERLFRIWARLAQLPSDPKPVQLKAAQARPATAEPIGPAPQAVAYPAKPDQSS